MSDKPKFPAAEALKVKREVWKPIVGLESKYSISSLGRIKRLTSVTSTNAGRILRPSTDTDGYKVVTFTVGNKVRKTFKVHRLLLLTFKPTTKRRLQGNHKNGKKATNRLKNLEWATQSKNMKHAYKNGLMSQIGEYNTAAKLSWRQVYRIRRLYASGQFTQNAIAGIFNVCRPTISMVVARKRWA